jgi:hypothetical protein
MTNPAKVFEEALKQASVSKEAEDMSWSEGHRLYGPTARKYLTTVSKGLEWDIVGAMWFCLFLLEDVNAHKEAAAVKKLFDRMDWGSAEVPPEEDTGDHLDRKYTP